VAATERLLRTAPAGHQARVEELLMTALGQTLAGFSGRPEVRIDLERHGREPLFEDVDTSRTVGWFTSIHPVELTLPDVDDTARCVGTVRGHLRGTPYHGIGYGLAGPPGPSAPVSFTYHGQVRTGTAGGLFTRLAGVPGSDRAADGVRPYRVEVDAAVVDGELRVHWTYGGEVYRRATVDGLADRFAARLTALLDSEPGAAPPERDFLTRLVPGLPSTRLRLRRHRVPGAGIALVADGELTAAWGEGRTAADGAEATADTLFQAGSVSKHVTTLGVLRLVREGVLDLDEDVNAYLKEWRATPADPDRPVTLRGLLAHTAGVSEDEFDSAGARHPCYPQPGLLDILEGRRPARTEPIVADRPAGAGFRYSGNNFVVVEQVLRERTGQPFPELMRELVLGPLEMRGSGYGPGFAERHRDRVALGHWADGAPVPGGWRVYPDATGGLWLTAADLGRVAAELHRARAGRGRVLDEAAAGLMLTPSSPAAYGLGTVVRRADGILWYGHSGETAGYRAYVSSALEPAAGLVAGLVVLANGDGGRDLLVELLVELDLDLHMRIDRP
jgi:non-ribosomal peptide synthase protein (TIGR01720 family)